MEKKFLEFDCVEVISEYVKLQKQGNNYVGICPFHDEKNKSLTVSQDKNLWKCFGCGAGGNAVNFVSKIEGISYKEAYVKLGIKYGYFDKNVVVKKDPNSVLYAINKDASSFFGYTLNHTKDGSNAKEYLKSRGIDESVIKKFEIGYAVHLENNPYKSALLEKGHSLENIKIAGLLNSKEGDLYQNRITLPIKNEFGEIQGFVGRTVKENLVRYLNTGETPIFKKGDSLFNLDKAVKSHKDEFIICEGSFDVIALDTAGIENSVCSLGTSLTEQQLLKIKHFVNKVVICFDSDNAGIKATLKAYKLCKKVGLESKFILLPEKDPSDFVAKYSFEKLGKFIASNKKSFFDFYILKYLSSSKSGEITVKYQNKLFELLASEPAIVQKDILSKWAKAVSIDEKLIKKDFFHYVPYKTEDLYNVLNAYCINSKRYLERAVKCLTKDLLPEREKSFLNDLYIYYNKYKKDSFDYYFFNSLSNNKHIQLLNELPKTIILSFKEVILQLISKQLS